MREYRPKRPLERLHRIDPQHYWRYPNLLRDESGRILSDNITYFKQATDSHASLEEIEREVHQYNSNIELVFHYTSGNQWIFLLSSGILNRKKLDQLQDTYDKLITLTN